MDPIADRFAWATTYNYAENSPITNIDLWGLQRISSDAVPKGIESFENATVPNYMLNDRSGIKAGSYTLHGARGENGAQFWIARQYRDNSTYADDYVVGPEAVKDFIDNTSQYRKDSNVRRFVQTLGGGSSLIEGFESTYNPANILFGISMFGKSLAFRTPKLSSAANTNQSYTPRFKTVFHKGELNNGQVATGRSLSTGTDRASVEALNRSGKVHQFDIPEDVYYQWESRGQIQYLKDYDFETGVYNSEVRFSGSVSGDLNQYIKNE